jgi:2-aminomuconate deaminase
VTKPVESRAAEPAGAYAYFRRAGNFLFLSGMGPRRRGSKEIPGVKLDAAGKVVSYDIEPQVRACFDNIRYILEEAGSSWDKIIDVQVFLTNLDRDFAAYNRVYAEYFPPGPSQPTRTTIGVTALPTAGSAPIAFEAKVIATV